MPAPGDRLRDQRRRPGLHIRTTTPAGQGLPRGRDGVPPHQPPARLPDLRPGGRVQAAGAVDGLRPGLLALHRAEEREAEADAARARGSCWTTSAASCARAASASARRSPRTTSSASPTAAATRPSPAIPGRKLENNYSLNTVDICPVGALTSTDFRFKMRVWFLKQTDQHRHRVERRGEHAWSGRARATVYRITPRQNDEVNDTWMADSGRVLYKAIRGRGPPGLRPCERDRERA